MDLWQRFKASEFWQQVATLVSGTFLAQAGALAMTPILTRLYDPEAFGISAAFIAIVAVFTVLANGGYEWAIMLPAKEEEAFGIFRLSLRLSWIFAAIFLVLTLLFGPALLRWLKQPELIGWHLLLPLSILIEGLCQVLRVALNRNGQYKALSFGRISKSWAQVLFSLILVLLGMGYEGLIIGFVLGQIANALFMGLPYLKWYKETSFSKPAKKLGIIARSYQDFPRYSLASNWLNQASKHLPYFFLPFFFSQEINGLFTQAERILFLPIVLVSMSIGNVYFEKASKAFQDGMEALADITRNTFRRLLILGLPFLVVILALGPQLFAWVLGEAWYTAGVYAQWLMPWIFLAFLASPLAYLVDIRRKLKVFMYFNLALFLVRLACLWIGSIYLSALETVMIYGLSSALMVLGQLLYQLKIGGLKLRGN